MAPTNLNLHLDAHRVAGYIDPAGANLVADVAGDLLSTQTPPTGYPVDGDQLVPPPPPPPPRVLDKTDPMMTRRGLHQDTGRGPSIMPVAAVIGDDVSPPAGKGPTSLPPPVMALLAVALMAFFVWYVYQLYRFVKYTVDRELIADQRRALLDPEKATSGTDDKAVEESLADAKVTHSEPDFWDICEWTGCKDCQVTRMARRDMVRPFGAPDSVGGFESFLSQERN